MRETSFDGYISAANGGRGLIELKGPRRCDNWVIKPCSKAQNTSQKYT